MPVSSRDLETYRRDERLGHKLLTPEERIRLIKVRRCSLCRNHGVTVFAKSLNLDTALPPITTFAVQNETSSRCEHIESTRREESQTRPAPLPPAPVPHTRLRPHPHLLFGVHPHATSLPCGRQQDILGILPPPPDTRVDTPRRQGAPPATQTPQRYLDARGRETERGGTREIDQRGDRCGCMVRQRGYPTAVGIRENRYVKTVSGQACRRTSMPHQGLLSS